MKRIKLVALIFSPFLFGIGHEVASADVVTGVTIEEVSSELVNGPFRRYAIHTIDGSGGVATNSYTGGHSGPFAEDVMWLTRGAGTHSGGAGGDPHVVANDGLKGHIVFDLGAVYDISQFHVWNYNEGHNGTTLGRGSKDVSVLFSETNTLTGLTASGPGIGTLGSPTSFTAATGGGGDLGTNYTTSFRGRYVRFNIASNQGGDDQFVGLSEVRFDGTLVPEPAIAALAALGLVGVGSFRRRRG